MPAARAIPAYDHGSARVIVPGPAPEEAELPPYPRTAPVLVTGTPGHGGPSSYGAMR